MAGSACGFIAPNLGEWPDLVSSPAGVGEIAESNLLILPVNASGVPRCFILHFCKFLILSGNPFLDYSALFRCLAKI
ncbi:hypothetical protein ACJEOV_001804 [Escherichia coli]